MQFISRSKAAFTQFFYDRTGAFKLRILASPLFLIGLIIKLYAGAIFASKNFTESFVPFVSYFVTHKELPYQFFYLIGQWTVFPYPPLMLYIMSAPGLLLDSLLNNDTFVVTAAEQLVYHLPIICADIVILLILSRWLQNKHTTLLWLYWLSPILLYINYIHSQLDVIPIALTFASLHFLFKERWLISYLLLGAAIATKLHIAVLLPFFLVYLWRGSYRFTTIGRAIFFTTATVLATIGTSLYTTAFHTIVLFNPEQGKIFDSTINLGSGLIYIVPAAYILLVLHSMTFTRFNRDTFVMFLGFSFGILILGIAPMPGWYYWVIPFLIYFYAKYERFSKIHFYVLTVAYFVYFGTTKTSDFISVWTNLFPYSNTLPNLYETILVHTAINPDTVTNIALTVLQAILCMNLLWLYHRGVEDSKRRKLYNMPYLIGIAGDSGSGKSTLAELLTKVFSETNLALVEGDAMHKWERGNEMWQKFTHLNPQANLLHEDVEHVKRLQNGDTTYRRHYDHATGTFTHPEKLDSKKVVVFEGLHSLYLTYMQRALDLKIFIAPEEQLRIHWKLCRDMRDRGYSRERVLGQIQARETDAKQYIATQAQHADIVFSLKSETDLAPVLGSDVIVETYLEIICDNTINVAKFINAIDTHINVEHHLTDQSHVIRIAGGIDSEVVRETSFHLVPELYNIVISEPLWEEHYSGVMQLFVIFYLFESLQLKNHES